MSFYEDPKVEAERHLELQQIREAYEDALERELERDLYPIHEEEVESA